MSATVVKNPPAAETVHRDPALDIRNQHLHEHIHHGPHVGRTSPDQPAYVRGMSSDDRHVPAQHSRAEVVEFGMNEKAEFPGVGDERGSKETGSLASQSNKPGRMGRFYQKYKIFVHLFFFLLVTG
jgi:CNT family concentrative nucleoside transporter